jgi:hypothetical protein
LEHRIKIQNALAAVESLYGTKAQPLTDQIRQILATLEEYQAQPDHERRQAVIQRLVQLKIGLERKYAGISDRDMTNCLAPTMRAMARSVGDAAIAVNAAPTVNLRTLNTYLSSLSDASTTLVAEVENQSDLPVSSVEVRLRLGRGTFTVAPDDANASLPEGLLPKGRRIVTFPIRRNPTKAGDREIVLLSGTFDAEGMTSLPLHDESQELPVQPFKSVIGGEGRIRNPYIATGAVPFERPENFHGRGELLNRIRGSVADQESREVLFLNGIRRIGKTSLLNMLEGAPPSGLIPVKVRLDVINPDSTGMFLYSLAALIVQKVEKHAKLTMDPLNLQSPEALEAFELRPQIEFPRVLDLVAPYLGGHKLFLMFDEFQLITEAIQRARSEGKTSRIDVNLLDMLRGYLEEFTTGHFSNRYP